MVNQGNTRFYSVVQTCQRIVMYETKTYYYIVGSNDSQTRFRILKIDRSSKDKLCVHDDKIVYNDQEIKSVLTMLDVGNRSKVGQKLGPGLNKIISAFGIVGFVKFLEGYYIILITKRSKAGLIGNHSVYKIEDTTMISGLEKRGKASWRLETTC